MRRRHLQFWHSTSLTRNLLTFDCARHLLKLAWAKFCNIHEAKSFANILFLRRKFFIIEMDEEDDMLAHINKVMALADLFNTMNVTISDTDILMTLFESLLPSYEYLIVAIDCRPIKELTLHCVTLRLLHKILRQKENDSSSATSAMLVKQSKGGASGSFSDKVSFHCGKKGHFPRNCFKYKNSKKDNANNTKVNNDYAFMIGPASCNVKTNNWIVDSGATSHIAPLKSYFYSYNPISPKNVILGDTMIEALGRGSVVVDTTVKGHIKTIIIKDVLHVPKLKANLLWVRHLVSMQLPVEFDETGSFGLSPSCKEVAVIDLTSN